ncbi:DNA repair helicase XPB [Desulfosarcina ovata]|uniref:DNA 3'-5' helicase n=2 Tax=Desulfosarcina ovata TaxID=83564 RepID=A0A5K8AC40_9BACT|nr:DNA repair helicase XPB [Desulfosarcina ovata]BBO83741.1 helicase [Desulfosarcina ovata subsp. sediminis]BBO90185.1 helicase [Desulfosarcina ovata subsp. ovata]
MTQAIVDTGPLIIQSDHTFMLETAHPRYADCRDFLASFAELVKSPEFIHTYRVTPLSMWNAAALEMSFDDIGKGLERFSRYTLPANVITDMREWHDLYGRLVLEKVSPTHLRLRVLDEVLLPRIGQIAEVNRFFGDSTADGWLIASGQRGDLKQALIKAGYPIKDICGYDAGAPLEIDLRDIDLDGQAFTLRDYQQDAVDAFYQGGRSTGGSGIIVLPCGSGKTIIGIGTAARISGHTLIITTNNVSVHQWRDELLAKTDLVADTIGEYTGLEKTVKPVTITTYQMLTHRRSKTAPMRNLAIFNHNSWGLIIYDEVHLLPAPVFRATTAIQAKRRLGLTATLVREDGKEDDVFALIGPKRYDVPWKTLENRGFIAEAVCTEYRIPLPREEEIRYARETKRRRYRVAAENPLKIELARELIDLHTEDHILVIGQYISQLEAIAEVLGHPLITGKTKHAEREKLYARFKSGDLRILIVSKVANFAVDLPDANVMIQISGTYGSRQEEAQRLGRILRPHDRRSCFYTLVSKGTDEQNFALNRQLFLVEQGYKYHIRYY